MKICKNCGQQTDDDKVRCPHCGFLFEEDMDDVLREMKSNLKTYRKELASSAPAPQPPVPQDYQQQGYAQPQGYAQTAQPQGYAQTAQPQGDFANSRERFELLSEVAQLKGEMRVLQGEIERMNANPRQQANPVAPVSVVYALQPAAQGQAPGVYSHYAMPAYMPAQNAAHAQNPPKKRSSNRIVISILCTLLLAVSIGMFFLPWIEITGSVKGAMTGFQGILYIFDKESADVAEFAMILGMIDTHAYAGSAAVAGIIQDACRYIVQWGVVVYAACLILSLPILFSLGGKVKARGWHRFWAWLSFLVALILFGIFCWTFGFSSMALWFLLGAGANFVRVFFLCFYKKGKKPEGGLQ